MGKERQELRAASDLQKLRSARVVGMTTSGAASKLGLLKSLKASVLLVEEAAEVLEAHVLAALTEDIQQLILIGDHKQLRPKIQTYRSVFYSTPRRFLAFANKVPLRCG